MSTNALEAIQPSNWSREQRRWMQAMLQPGPTPPWSSWQGGVRQAEAAGAVYINNVRANVIRWRLLREEEQGTAPARN